MEASTVTEDLKVLKVLVVEDQRTFADALVRTVRQEPGLEPVGPAATGAEALRMAALEVVDVAIVDVGLPDLDGLELCRRLRRQWPAVRVVLLTADPRPALARRAVDVGARAFLSKWMSLDTLLSAVLAGDDTFVVDPALLMAYEETGPGTLLSPREAEILQLMTEGHDARSIAGALHLSVHTTRGYIKNVYRKLDVHSQLAAVAAVTRRGVVRAGC